MSGESAGHWQRIYQTKAPTELSWYESVPQRSLDLIQATGVPLTAPIIDIGGGDAQLVDHLLAAGYTDVTVLDIASAALARTRGRLGPAAARVEWIAADVATFLPKRRYALWHDRAVFHFLTSLSEQGRYLTVLEAGLARQGHLILATFGPLGPSHCSGLPVQRYSKEELSSLLGFRFQLRRCESETHLTPTGQEQQFLWSWWQASG
jgi:SAM-dependent methyltransferase